jgi:hypothetical protein
VPPQHPLPTTPAIPRTNYTLNTPVSSGTSHTGCLQTLHDSPRKSLGLARWVHLDTASLSPTPPSPPPTTPLLRLEHLIIQTALPSFVHRSKSRLNRCGHPFGFLEGLPLPQHQLNEQKYYVRLTASVPRVPRAKKICPAPNIIELK